MGKIILVLSLVLVSVIAKASSPKAWEEFRADVEKQCIRKFTASRFGDSKNKRILVDPFGTESSGVALVRGYQRKYKTEVTVLCLYDKKAQKVTDFLDLPDLSKQDHWKAF